MSRRRRTDRRQFLKTVGLAGVSSALVAPALSVAQAPVTPVAPAAPGVPADTTQAAKPPEISEDARALAGVIQRRYGERLTKEQMDAITRDFDGDLKATKRLREVKLTNADEPDFVFKA